MHLRLNTMRFLITAFLLFLIFGVALAQFPPRPGASQSVIVKGTIKGMLIDSVTNQPLAYASVVLALPGGKLLDGQITDEKGMFRFKEVNTSTYMVRASFIGYEDKIINSVTTTPQKPDLDLGRLLISPSGINLDEIIVTEEAPIVENRIDKIVYNADKDLTNIGGDGTDVLRKVPLLSVDLEGNVSLRGNNNVRIFINGKPSSMFAGNVADALKSLPADQIKSVEVITSPTAKYDAEGSTGIINIVLKKAQMQGLTGSVNASVGTRANNLDLSLAVASGRFGFNTNLGSRFTWMRPGTNSFSRYDDLPGDLERSLIQEGDNRSAWRGLNGSIGAFYDFNAYNSINSTVRLNGFQLLRNGTTNATFEDPSLQIAQQYSRYNDDSSLGSGFDWSTDYKKTFPNKKDMEWSLGYQLSGRQSLESTLIDQSGDPLLIIQQDNDNNGLNLEHIAQTDLILPLGNGIKLETGLKATLRRLKSTFDYNNFDPNSGQYVRDSLTSGAFHYDQDVGAAYVSLQYNINSKYDIIAGVRYEYTTLSGDPANGEPGFGQQYGNLLPSIIVARKFGAFTNLKFSYNQRLQRPGLRYVNPYQQLNDPRNITVGNPELLPELANQFEISYGSFVNGSAFNVAVYYRYTSDIIEQFLIVDDLGISRNTFNNIGQNEAIGANLFGTTAIFKKKLTIRGSIDVNTYASSGTVNGSSLSNSDINWRSFLNFNYDFGKGYKADLFGMFRSHQTTLQGRIPSFWIYSFAFQKEISKKLSFGLVIIEPFNLNKNFRTNLVGETFRQEANFSVPFQSFGVNVRYAFGKMDTRQRSRSSKIKNDDMKSGEDMQF